MKKTVKKIAKVVITIAVIVFLVLFEIWFMSDHGQVKEGTYYAVNSASYPEAYIVVQDGFVQFFNIDLNEMYKQQIVNRYITYMEGHKERKLTEKEKKQIENAIDLNERFCDSKFAINKEDAEFFYDDLTGIGNYNFGFVTNGDALSYEYNSRKKTITLTREEAEQIVFERG